MYRRVTADGFFRCQLLPGAAQFNPADQPKRPHHRQSACAAEYKAPCRKVENGTCCAGESGTGCCNLDGFMSDKPAVIQIKGGLVGGPDQNDHFPDIRNDYQRSEVALDFNAGFTGAAAGLTSFSTKNKLKACGNTGTGKQLANQP